MQVFLKTVTTHKVQLDSSVVYCGLDLKINVLYVNSSILEKKKCALSLHEDFKQLFLGVDFLSCCN